MDQPNNEKFIFQNLHGKINIGAQTDFQSSIH
jgi:hypothetical protein